MARSEIQINYWVCSNHKDYKDTSINELFYKGVVYIVKVNPSRSTYLQQPSKVNTDIEVFHKDLFLIEQESEKIQDVLYDRETDEFNRKYPLYKPGTNKIISVEKFKEHLEALSNRAIRTTRASISKLDEEDTQEIIDDYALYIKDHRTDCKVSL